MDKSWDDATPDEIRDARIQSLEDSVRHLKDCVEMALRYGAPAHNNVAGYSLAADILNEEWSK